MKKYLCSVLAVLIVFLGIIFTACGENSGSYDITTYINGARFGDVSGSGTYNEGSRVTISATPKSTATANKYKFLCWVHQNKVASLDANYTFTVNKSTAGSYIALFESPDLEYTIIDSITLSDVDYTNVYNDVDVTSIDLKVGSDENNLIKIYSMSLDDNNIIYELSRENLLGDDQLPYTFNKTQNLYAQINITYLRAGNFDYTSSTDIIINFNSENNYQLNDPVSNGGTARLTKTDKPQLSITFSPLSDYLQSLIENE